MMGIHLRAAATILAICAVWRVSATNNTDTIQSNDDLQKLQTTMLNIQTNLLGLTTAIAARNGTVDGLNSRIATIEQSLEEVRKIIHVETQRNSSEKTWNNGVFEQVIAAYNTTQQQMKPIREKLEQLIQKARANAEVHECIAAIRNRDLGKAEEKLYEIDDEFKTNFIIREVYDHDAQNFDLIISFAKSLASIENTLWVLKALKFEMDSNNHNDPKKLVDLIEAFNDEVISQLKVTLHQKSAARDIVRQLRESIVRSTREFVMTGLRDGVMSKETTSIASRVHTFDNELTSRVLEEAINEIYSSADKWKMIKAIRKFDYIEQVIAALNVMMDKIQEKGHINNPEILSFAHAAYAMFKQDNYAKVNDLRKAMLTKVIDKLPTSVKSIGSGSTLCIQSVQYNISMYADIDYYKYDKFRRRVFGWIPGNQVKNGKWAFERSNDENNIYYIKNKDFNEYLQASEKSYDEDRRNVFCWKEGGKVGAAKFVIEPHGDNVYIKNELYGEYLYMAIDYFRYNNERREIFTWKPGGKDNQSLFIIVKC